MTFPFEITRSLQSHTQILTDAYPSLSIKTKFIERIRVIDISFSKLQKTRSVISV